MAVQAVSVAQMLRDSNVKSTGFIVFTTSSGFAFEYDLNDRVAFMVCWVASSEVAEARYMRLTVQPGDFWRSGIGSETFLIQTCSSGASHWLFGPFDMARFGIAATSSGLVTLGENYLDVMMTVSCSSLCNSTGAALTAGFGDIQVHAFKLPEATFST